jgi:hypothetical protein
MRGAGRGRAKRQTLDRATLGGALAYAGSRAHGWPRSLPGAPEARAWLAPRSLTLSFRAPSDARRARILLARYDRKARSTGSASVVATVPWALAAAVVTAVGLPRLVAVQAGTP